MKKTSVLIAVFLVIALCFATIGELSKAEAAEKVIK